MIVLSDNNNNNITLTWTAAFYNKPIYPHILPQPLPQSNLPRNAKERSMPKFTKPTSFFLPPAKPCMGPINRTGQGSISELGHRIFVHRMIKFKASMTWNKLPQSLTVIRTCQAFKQNLKVYLTFNSTTGL
jgi:hypothetical protein